MDYLEKAMKSGFDHASIIKVSDLEIVPEYRKYCEDNICGNYDKLKQCPPESGTVEEMVVALNKYKDVLILNTVVEIKNTLDINEHIAAKHRQNVMTDNLLKVLLLDGLNDCLVMSAGPWKNYSCMSAYCVDAQKMADKAGMKCWENDGKARYFSLILF